MELSKEEIIKRANVIANSDKAIDELNDQSKKHENLLKLLNSWKEEDSEEESKNHKSVSLG